MRRRRILTMLSAVSFLLLVGFLAACVFDFNRGREPMTLTGIRLWGEVRIGPYGGNFSVFNDGEPYAGSIIDVMRDGQPGRVATQRSLTWPGIYYRHFLFRDGSSYWTLSVSKAYPVVLSGILPAFWVVLRAWGGKKSQADRAETADTDKGKTS